MNLKTEIEQAQKQIRDWFESNPKEAYRVFKKLSEENGIIQKQSNRENREAHRYRLKATVYPPKYVSEYLKTLYLLLDEIKIKKILDIINKV